MTTTSRTTFDGMSVHGLTAAPFSDNNVQVLDGTLCRCQWPDCPVEYLG